MEQQLNLVRAEPDPGCETQPQIHAAVAGTLTIPHKGQRNLAQGGRRAWFAGGKQKVNESSVSCVAGRQGYGHLKMQPLHRHCITCRAH